jgi:transposase InsO family protein
MPQHISSRVEQKVLTARRRRRRGAVVLAAELGLNPSTVGRILARHQMPHLRAIDPITGEPVRLARHSPTRYEHLSPGSLVHVHVKRLGRIPQGGGWRLHGCGAAASVAYSEVLPDEKDLTCAESPHRAIALLTAQGVRVRRPLTDNAMVYRRGTNWGWVCTAWGLRRRFIKLCGPWTNGKAERFNRTLLNEWACAHEDLTNSYTATTLNHTTPPLAYDHPSAGSPPDNNVSGHGT